MASIRTFAIVAAAVLLLGAGLAAATDDTNYDETDDRAYEPSRCNFKALREADDWKAQLKDCLRHRAPRSLPPFTIADGRVDGRFVSFERDGAEGVVRDYTVKGPLADVVVFDMIAVAEYDADAAKERTKKGLYAAYDGRHALFAFNAPNGAWFLGARESTTVTMDLADGFEAVLSEDGKRVALSHEGHGATIVLRGEGALSIEGDVVTATLDGPAMVAFHVDGYPRLLALETLVVSKIVDRAREHRDARGADLEAI